MSRRRIAATGTLLAVLALLVAVAACAGESGAQQAQRSVAALGDGVYRVAGGEGFDPGAAASILAITARLDRAAGRLVLTLADGSSRTLVFRSRDRSAWRPDCFTGAGGPPSYVTCEVADLSPAPLRLESLTFATPLVYAKCGPSRMILSDRPDDAPATAFLILDRP